MHLKALLGLIAVPTCRFEPVCVLLFNSQTVLMAASIFLSDLSQISRITLNPPRKYPGLSCLRLPVPPREPLRLPCLRLPVYYLYIFHICRSPFRTANGPAADKAALARRRRYEIIVEALKEIKSSPQLIFHSKSTQTSPLQASAKKTVEVSSESEDESHDGTPARRVVVVFDSDEEGLDRVLPASYPVDEARASSPFAQAYGSPDLSPPTPAQRQRRYVSPSLHSSSSDYLPMPGAFPLTPCLVQEPTTPHTQRDNDLCDYAADFDWKSDDSL